MILDDYMKIVRSVTNLRVIPANDNGPKPAKPYITARLSVANPQPVHKGVLLEGKRTNSSHRTGTLQLQVIGPDSWSLAEALSMRLLEESTLDLAEETYNISWFSQPRLQDVPMLVDDQTYEQRVILEIATSYTMGSLETTGVIEAVEGEFSTSPGTTEPITFMAGDPVVP